MKTRNLFFAIGLLTNFLNAQNSQFAPNIFRAAPDVAGLIKYAEIPVDIYNGTTQFNIPLYHLNEGDISLPISLNYYSNGFKVEEESSWVGLGWSLNAGGVIQHITSGNDNYSPRIVPTGSSIGETNYVGDFTTNLVQRGCTFQGDDGQPVTLSHANNYSIASFGYQYNLYLYNFAGYSGKYIKDRDNNYIVLDKSNIKFEDLPDDGGFKATTSDGTQYFFSVKGSVFTPSFVYGPCGSNFGLSGTTSYSYYLSKIISPNNNEVNFSYSSSWTKSAPNLSQWHTKSNVDFSQPKKYMSLVSDILDQRLIEINTQNTKIKFNAISRVDVLNSKKLSSIEIFDRNAVVSTKAIKLNLDYFVGDISFGDFTTQNESLGDCGFLYPAPNVDIKSKRLKLLSVVFSNTIASIDNSSPKYTFDYDASPIPYKTSLAKDIWGYFNGQNNKSLLPDVNNLGYYDSNIPAYFSQNSGSANRKSYESYMKAGVLNRIIQPTGGFTSIQYNANQFENMLGTSNSIRRVAKYIYDYNSTEKQSFEFTIPAISNQYVTLDIKLICNSYGPCSQNVLPGECPGYYNSGTSTVHPNDNRLYILVEKKSGNIWSIIKEYNRATPELVANGNSQYVCGFENNVVNMEPGIYRITVNYPDNKIGFLGGPWAEAVVEYYDYIPAQQNLGAGLRVASIAEYTSENEKFNEKNYTYIGGKVISKPIFYREIDREELIAVTQNYNYVPECPIVVSVNDLCDGPTQPINANTKMLFSDTIIPYSYNANGSLVGYNEVKVSYGVNTVGQTTTFLGDEIFKFKNEYDNLFYIKSILGGIPGARRLDNGKVLEKLTNKILNPGQPGPVLFPVKKEIFEYEVKNFRNYWAFKPDYQPYIYSCIGTIISAHNYGLNYNFINFYPIKCGKVVLKKKTEIDYNGLQSSLPPNITITKTTDYYYNTKNQLTNEKFTESNGDLYEMITYYPHDLLGGTQNSQMQELISLNKIDTPVKTETIVAGVRVRQQQTKFVKDATTSNILLAKEIHDIKGSAEIVLTTTANRKIVFNLYDAKGNILQYTPEAGTPVSILWGHNKTLPIAKIDNASISQVLTALSVASVDDIDESDIAAINALRTNTTFVNRMISTYVYEPLVGLVKMTDPKGEDIFYTYDSLGRLKEIKDREGNILSQNEYHYKP